MPAPEDELTELLWAALGSGGAPSIGRLCQRVCGTGGFDAEGTELSVSGTRDLDLPVGPTRGLVVGIAGGTSVTATHDGGWAEGRPDAALWNRDTLVVFEFKLPGRKGLVRSQLLRHASHARLDLDWDAIDVGVYDLPTGVAAASWSQVMTWLDDERVRSAVHAPLDDVAVALADYDLALTPHPLGRKPSLFRACLRRLAPTSWTSAQSGTSQACTCALGGTATNL